MEKMAKVTALVLEHVQRAENTGKSPINSQMANHDCSVEEGATFVDDLARAHIPEP